jgi:hypothetical protein
VEASTIPALAANASLSVDTFLDGSASSNPDFMPGAGSLDVFEVS